MKKSKITNFHVTIYGDNDSVMVESTVNHLPLKEEVIIAQSIRSFNDPEPCMIHRSAVMKKIYVEFLDCFEESFSGSDSEEIGVVLPEVLLQKLDVREGVRRLVVKRC